MKNAATTFSLLRRHGACEDGYRKLAKHRGGVSKYGRDKPIPLTVVLDSNGIEDTCWCLRATLKPCDRDARLFAVDCAEHVLHHFEDLYPHDTRPREAIDAARAFARGEIDHAARSAARAAAWAAEGAAEGAAAAGPAAWAAAAWAADAGAAAAGADAWADAAWAAAAGAAAAGAAEGAWQEERLLQYLTGETDR